MLVLRSSLIVVALVVLASTVQAAESGALKAGWTEDGLKKESAACTEQLVQGAWENTKRDQGADPSLPLTPEIRAQLAPQIAGMEKLCACAIREGAKRYTKAEADATPADLERFVGETIAKGTCKLE